MMPSDYRGARAKSIPTGAPELIDFACPCQQLLRSRLRQAGRVLHCPTCGGKVLVPIGWVKVAALSGSMAVLKLDPGELGWQYQVSAAGS